MRPTSQTNWYIRTHFPWNRPFPDENIHTENNKRERFQIRFITWHTIHHSLILRLYQHLFWLSFWFPEIFSNPSIITQASPREQLSNSWKMYTFMNPWIGISCKWGAYVNVNYIFAVWFKCHRILIRVSSTWPIYMYARSCSPRKILMHSKGYTILQRIAHTFHVLLCFVVVWLRKILRCCLTHWGRDKMAAFSQKRFSHIFSWTKMDEFQSRFHWSLFPRFQLTTF